MTVRDTTARLASRLLFVLPPLAWGLASGCGGAGNVQLLADAATDGGGDATSPSSDAATGVDGSSGDAAVSDAGSPCACAPGETCCLYSSGGGTIHQQTCATTCALPDGGGHLSSLACTGSDCPNGDVCCIWRSGNDNVSQCKASCSNQNNEVQMCNPALADAGCPTSQPCSSNNITDWDLSPPLATCGGRGVP